MCQKHLGLHQCRVSKGLLALFKCHGCLHLSVLYALGMSMRVVRSAATEAPSCACCQHAVSVTHSNPQSSRHALMCTHVHAWPATAHVLHPQSACMTQHAALCRMHAHGGHACDLHVLLSVVMLNPPQRKGTQPLPERVYPGLQGALCACPVRICCPEGRPILGFRPNEHHLTCL